MMNAVEAETYRFFTPQSIVVKGQLNDFSLAEENRQLNEFRELQTRTQY